MADWGCHHPLLQVNKNAKFQLGMEEAKRIMEDFRSGNRSSSLLVRPRIADQRL